MIPCQIRHSLGRAKLQEAKRERGVIMRCLLARYRFIRNGRKRPARLPYSFYKWIPIVYRYTQEEVIELAGMDAAMYLRVLMFGRCLPLQLYGEGVQLVQYCSSRISKSAACCNTHTCSVYILCIIRTCGYLASAGAELFFFLTIWCLIVVLPTNLSVSLIIFIMGSAPVVSVSCSCCSCWSPAVYTV